MSQPRIDQRIFLRVVELGSIRAAARELGQEPSSVSRRMAGLEARLGTKLLERAGAATRPTAAGQRYYQGARDLIAQFDALEADVSGEAETPTGLLKVNATIDFGQAHVARWLLDFKRHHPGVEVELALSSRNVDLISSATDVAIRVGLQSDSSLIARKLADVPRVLVAAPAYLAARGTPEAPADLADHDFIFFQAEHRQRPLELTDPAGRTHRIPRTGGVTINAARSIVDAVTAGFGLHAGPRWAFQRALEKGEAVELLPDHTQPVLPMYAVRAPSYFVPARTRAFIAFAREKVGTVRGLTL